MLKFQIDFFKETLSVILSDPSMQRWQCPIHIGTIKSYVCLTFKGYLKVRLQSL